MDEPKKIDLTKMPDKPKSATMPQEQLWLARSIEIALEGIEDDCPLFVEIGTHRAGTARMVIAGLNQLEAKSRFYTCDPNNHPGINVYSYWDSRELKQVRNGGFCSSEYFEVTSDELAKQVDGKVAWLFVDGCHCYECVSNEIMTWVPRIQGGGIVVFHDFDARYGNEDQMYHGDARSNAGAYKAVVESELLRPPAFEIIHENCAKTHRKGGFFGGMRIYRRVE